MCIAIDLPGSITSLSTCNAIVVQDEVCRRVWAGRPKAGDLRTSIVMCGEIFPTLVTR